MGQYTKPIRTFHSVHTPVYEQAPSQSAVAGQIPSLRPYSSPLQFVHHKSLAQVCDMTGLYETHKVDENRMHENYQRHYERHLCDFKNLLMQLRKDPFTLLEIGRGAAPSTLFWEEWLPQSRIVSLDIVDWSGDVAPSSRTVLLKVRTAFTPKGSQANMTLLSQICNDYDDIDLIIDDGSHINQHVIQTFTKLFGCLRRGGLYVIEDVQTSYWREYGGSCNPTQPNTTLYLIKSLVDHMNYKELPLQGVRAVNLPSVFSADLGEISFAHNIVFLAKENNEYPIDNTRNIHAPTTC